MRVTRAPGMESKQRGVRRGKQQLGLLSWGRAAAHRSGGGLAAVFAIAAIVVGLAAWTSQALADFPYIGDGTSGNPASWALAPGHVPTNLGGLGWKFAATPADPNVQKTPGEKLTIEQNNSQQDELCGVTGMSLVDSHATVPSGFGS